MVNDYATTGRYDVAVPVHAVPVRELGHEPLGDLGQDHRRFIAPTRFASHVADERERPTPRARYLGRHPIQRVVQ